MDWSGITTLDLRWYDWIFLLVSAATLLALPGLLTALIIAGGWDHGWRVSSDQIDPGTLGFWTTLVHVTIPGLGVIAYFLQPRRYLRPMGRVLCSFALFPLILIFCLLAMDAIGVTKSTYLPLLGHEL